MVFEKFEVVDEKTLKFTMAPVCVTYANTLRRSVQTDVATLGFRADMLEDGSTSDVKIFKNTTPMSNEMLADRVGLLPIIMPDSATWDKESVLFRLHVKNETDSVRIVTASDFECLENQPTSDQRFRIPNTKFFHPNPLTGETCIIAVLKPMADGQNPEEIELETYATMGIGREHTRFNPVAQCAYAYTRDEDPAKILDLWKDWLLQQKKVDVADLEKEKDADRKAMLEREFRSLEIHRCFLTDEDGEPFSYDFTVESVGTMDVYRIILEALNGVANRCEKYAAMDKELPESVEIRPADARMKGFDIWFQNEDHTLGNLFQTWIDANKGAFVGYKVPHPLRDEMVLRLGVDDGSEVSARLIVAEAATACANMFREWAVDWTVSVQKAGIKANGGEVKTVWQAHADSKKKGK